MLNFCIIILQDIASTAQQVVNSGVDWTTIGGTGGGGGLAILYYELMKRKSRNEEKENSQCISDTKASEILLAIDELKRRDDHKDKITETHAVITKEDEKGIKRVHSASFELAELSKSTVKLSESVNAMAQFGLAQAEIHKTHREDQKDYNAAQLEAMRGFNTTLLSIQERTKSKD